MTQLNESRLLPIHACLRCCFSGQFAKLFSLFFGKPIFYEWKLAGVVKQPSVYNCNQRNVLSTAAYNLCDKSKWYQSYLIYHQHDLKTPHDVITWWNKSSEHLDSTPLSSRKHCNKQNVFFFCCFVVGNIIKRLKWKIVISLKLTFGEFGSQLELVSENFLLKKYIRVEQGELTVLR